MRLNIKVNRFYWATESILFFFLGTGASIFLVVVGLGSNARGSNWAVLVGVTGAVITLYISVRDLCIALSDPYLTLDSHRVNIKLPLIFRSDLTLERPQVRAVMFGPAFPYGRPSKHSPIALAWKRSPKLSPPQEHEGKRPTFNNHTLPDLSGLGWFKRRNFIILLADPIPLRDHVRRGLALPNLYAPGDYCGPTRTSVAHGFCAELADLSNPEGTLERINSMSWEVTGPEGMDEVMHGDD